MAGKTDFTPAEWEQLLKAPLWASMIVVAASPSGPLGVAEGGCLGIGGTRVDEQEKAVLSDIGKALGVSV